MNHRRRKNSSLVFLKLCEICSCKSPGCPLFSIIIALHVWYFASSRLWIFCRNNYLIYYVNSTDRAVKNMKVLTEDSAKGKSEKCLQHGQNKLLCKNDLFKDYITYESAHAGIGRRGQFPAWMGGGGCKTASTDKNELFFGATQ